MWYFLKKLGTRPGTGMFLALAAIGIGMLVPAAAPGLVIAAAVMLGWAALTLPFYIWGFFKNGSTGNNVGGYAVKDPNPISYFFKNHPAQAIALTLGLAVFVATMVLVIGGLTGAFPFMLPLLAAVAAPFTAAAMAGGLSLAVPVLVGFTLILASLNLTNVLKSVLAWFDSFRYDGPAGDSRQDDVADDWIALSRAVKGRLYQALNDKDVSYFSRVARGVVATIMPLPSKPIFTSPDAMRIDGKDPTEVPEKSPKI
jgi:hypothetical protein